MRYVPGYKGPTSPGPGPRPAVATTRPMFGSNAATPKPASLAPVVSTRPPAPAPTGPMTPVRGGGMAPASVATMMKKMKKGGKVKCMSKGGSTASKRADGCAVRGKTKGKMY